MHERIAVGACVLVSDGLDLSSVRFFQNPGDIRDAAAEEVKLQHGTPLPVLVSRRSFRAVLRLLVAPGTLGPGARERGAAPSHHVATRREDHQCVPPQRTNSQVG